MNKLQISLILLSVALIVSVTSNVFLYVELEEKNAEIGAKNTELEEKIAEITAKNTELDAKNADIDAKNSEIEAKNAEIADKNADIEAKNSEIDATKAELEEKESEIAELTEPKLTWDISYTDVREEFALPGYHLLVTGTITNYGLTDVYNLRIQVIAYYVTGELAINKTEPPGASIDIPNLPAGTTYEFNRWVYYEPGLIDTVTITPLWDKTPS